MPLIGGIGDSSFFPDGRYPEGSIQARSYEETVTGRQYKGCFMTHLFKKTGLALLISAATASQAMAQTYDVSQGPMTFSGTVSDGLILTGQRTQVSSNGTYGEAVAQFNLQGSLLNQANYTFTSAGPTVQGYALIGLGVDAGEQVNGNYLGSTINGDVINTGTISANSPGYMEAFEIGRATIQGSLINNGTISIQNSTDAEGMYVHGATIGGDLVNKGTIDVEGEYATGLILDEDWGRPISIGGSLINSGTLKVAGIDSTALDLETSTSPLRIVNTGLIRADGENNTGIYIFDNVSVDSLKNSGQIIVTGTGSTGVMIDGPTFNAGGISNSGTIQADDTAIKVSAATPALVINQQAGLISGATAIDGGGQASLNWTGGAIAGDLQNLSAITVNGQANYLGGTLGSNVAVNGGSLNLKQQGTTLNGNLDVASGAGVDLQLSNSVVPTTAYLTVNGSATFAQGSKVTVSATPGDFSATTAGTQYQLLKATLINNNGLSVSSSSALLNVASYSVDGQTVNALVTLKSDQQVSQDLGTQTDSQPVAGVLNPFKNDVLGKLGSNDPVFQAFANAPDETQLVKLAKSLAPEVNRGGVDAAISGQALSNNAVFGRVAGLRSGLSSGDVLSDTGVWVQGLSSNMDQDSRNGVSGYSANASGIAVGADGKLNANTTLGLAYSYLNTNVGSDDGNKTDVEGNALTLYGSWDLDQWFVDGSLSYGHNNNDSKRYIAGTEAKGSYDSNVLSLNALAGYTFNLNDHLQFEPRVAARYSNVRIDGFNEHGSSADLQNSAQRFEVGELGAGARLIGDLPLAGGNLKPEATLMAYHDLIGDRVSQTSSFELGGSSFVVSGASPVRDSYEGSVGLNYQINAVTVGASYTYQTKTGFDANTVLFKARYDF